MPPPQIRVFAVPQYQNVIPIDLPQNQTTNPIVYIYNDVTDDTPPLIVRARGLTIVISENNVHEDGVPEDGPPPHPARVRYPVIDFPAIRIGRIHAPSFRQEEETEINLGDVDGSRALKLFAIGLFTYAGVLAVNWWFEELERGNTAAEVWRHALELLSL